jgi:hypothetical protein
LPSSPDAPKTSVHLPTEIIDQIGAQLQPFESPSLVPTQTLPPSAWRELLFSRKILPWLWDLDSSVLESRRSDSASSYTEGEWDWELLVRQLAQVDVFNDENIIANVQLRLRNRRRIWRLVDEARMGDWATVLKFY